jgi:hypothetical protein
MPIPSSFIQHIENPIDNTHRQPSSIVPRSSFPRINLVPRHLFFVLSSYRLAHFVVIRASRATSGFGSAFYFSFHTVFHTTIAVSLPLSSLYHVTSGSLVRDRAPLTSVVATHLGDYACCPSHPVIRKGVDNSIWSRCSDSVTGRSSALSTFPLGDRLASSTPTQDLHNSLISLPNRHKIGGIAAIFPSALKTL